MRRNVLFCGTHPAQFNGYSKVMFELSNELSKFDDINLYIYGFQNYYDVKKHIEERSLTNVTIHDAYLSEEPKNKGFGESNIIDYVNKISPDIVIVYNDLSVICTMLKKLSEIPDRKFKIVPYIDLVYKNQSNKLLKFIDDNSDAGIAFTEHWKQVLVDQVFKKPLWILEHGFNKKVYYPIPQKIARKYFSIDEKSFVIMNLNRNQPRKRWDNCIMAYIKFISTHLTENIKLLVLTAVTGAWDLSELITFEAKKYNLTLQDVKPFFTFVQNPQKLSDNDINIMYNVADIGWNTCDGEGFGLCNFEQAGVGIPQIIPHIGGFLDFFNESNSIPVKPTHHIYSDNTNNAVGGILELCSIDDYVNALERYYSDRELILQHGKQARSDVTKYEWKQKAEHLRKIIIESTQDLFPVESNIMEEMNDLINKKDDEVTEVTEVTQVEDDINKMGSHDDVDDLIQKKINEQQNESSIQLKITPSSKPVVAEPQLDEMTKDDLISLQQKINKLLN